MLNIAVSLALMGYILLGVANRLVASTLRRRREWQLLRAVGATPRQLRTMAWSETLLVCLIATVIGLVISLGPMTMLAIGFVGKPGPRLAVDRGGDGLRHLCGRAPGDDDASAPSAARIGCPCAGGVIRH